MHKPKTVDPITLLPFVKDRPNWKPEDGRKPRDFWAVNTTGDYGADCAVGVEFAKRALDYINAEDHNCFLGWAVLDMIGKGEESLEANSGLIVGFMGEIARAAAYGYHIHKTVEEATPGATIAIMGAPQDLCAKQR
jgi:hypothetical protein